MKKTVKLNKTKDGEFYIKLKDFKSFVDTKKVKSYKLEEIYDEEGGCAIITFYDKDGKVIKKREEE